MHVAANALAINAVTTAAFIAKLIGFIIIKAPI